MNPHEIATWLASEEAKQFMSASSQHWSEASVAAGTDPAAAQAAAERTIAAYTGSAVPAS